MGWIEKRQGKNGVTYRLCTQDGDKVRRQTWKPEQGMTARQAEKAAGKALTDFEQAVQKGYLSEKITVDELIDRWFKDYADVQLKPRTVQNYRLLRPRVSQAMGHLRVDKIRPAHLMAFYSELSQTGVRLDMTYTATQELCSVLERSKQRDIMQAARVGENAVRHTLQGKAVSQRTAQRIAYSAGVPFERAYNPVDPDAKLTADTIKHYHRFLSAVFAKAVKWGLVQENVCARVDSPKMEQTETQILDEDGVAALLDALQDAPPLYSTITQLALLTGCRRGELCALRWSDVNFKNATLCINRSAQWIQGQGVVFGTPKTAKSRRVLKMSSDTVQLLQEWRKEQIQMQLAAGFAWTRTLDICGETVENDLIFTRSDGRPIDPNKITSWFPRFLREHNLPSVRFHSLRHTCASLLIAAHVPVTTVSGRLGHTRTSTTMDIYAASIRSADAAAADALDGIFEKIHKKQHDASVG